MLEEMMIRAKQVTDEFRSRQSGDNRAREMMENLR